MITDLRLQHFRSYGDSSFELSPGVNIVVGPNASGKTNLLEAVMVLAVGQSYRAKDGELIRFDQPWARIEAHTITGQRQVTIKNDLNRVQKDFVIDDQKLTRLSHAKSLPIVLFEPNNLLLLHGAPELRRAYLDDLLERLVSGYKQLSLQYKRALRQRNALLKQGYAQAQGQLFAWNLRLSELGQQVVNYRQQLVADLQAELSAIYSDLAQHKTVVKLEYKSHAPADNYASYLLKRLEEHNQLDCERGFTADGPHRDDLTVYINGKDATMQASRGEIRTLVLALKIIELSLLESAYDRAPLLLLDDVFSELDGTRRRALTDHLKDRQTFITTTDADVVTHSFTKQANIIPLTGE